MEEYTKVKSGELKKKFENRSRFEVTNMLIDFTKRVTYIGGDTEQMVAMIFGS